MTRLRNCLYSRECHGCLSFFPKLLSDGYEAHWTKGVDIFNNRLLIFPVHLGARHCGIIYLPNILL